MVDGYIRSSNIPSGYGFQLVLNSVAEIISSNPEGRDVLNDQRKWSILIVIEAGSLETADLCSHKNNKQAECFAKVDLHYK